MELNREKIEDVYPLTPMQQGLLFHTLEAPDSGVYTIQLCCRIGGALDRDALRRAWSRAIARHAVLRTSFAWKRTRRPLQVVHRRVEPEWRLEDWGDVPPEARRRRLDELLAADRGRGFDLHKAPLLRFHLLRQDDADHRFVLSVHHLLVDGWSMTLLLAEVLALYTAEATGAAVELPPVRPFGDYVAWLGEAAPRDVEEFWRRRLADLRETTPLPVPWGGEGGAAVVHRHLGRKRSDRLRAFARRHELTLNTLFQAAWALVLGRWADRRDVVFGTVLSGRPAELPGAETMVGLFINTLPLRVALPPAPARVELLHRVQREAAAQREYQHTPLVEAQGWSGLPHSRPLFESLLVFENYPAGRAVEEGRERSGGALDLTVGEVESVERTSYPLTVAVMPEDDVLVRLEVDRGRCDDTAARRMLGHLVAALDGLVAAPQEPLGRLDLLAAAERQQVLHEWNDTRRPRDGAATVPRLIGARAAATPDAPAVVQGEQRITYRRLAADAEALAASLAARGVRRGEVVALAARRTPDLPAMVLAILACGGVYLPLDPSYPRRRLDFLLRDSRARWLLRGTEDGDLATADGVEVLSRAELAAGDPEREPVAPEPGDAAYVIYTSGSTGRPKGVVVEHRALVNRILGGQETCPLEPDDRVLQSAALSFDFSIWELLAPLVAGATVVLPDGDAGDPAHVDTLLRRHRITVAHTVPSLGRVLLDQGVFRDLPDLRLFFSGGEAPDPRLVGGVVDGTGARLVNQYGPTEATVDATFWPCRPEDGAEGADVPMGRPLPNYRAHILDAALEPLPAGAAGQLVLAGPGLARGYLGRPGLTAERFLPDPFSPRPGGRLYRTGDRARRRPDGALHFLGRDDDQVQLRGIRLELGEVEAAVSSHPRVRRAVAAVWGDGGEDRRLVAWVEVDGGEAAATDLRAHLEERVPRYMVPSLFVPVAELLRTPAGKVDRSALPDPRPAAAPEVAAELGADPLEEVVASVYADVLGRGAVGRNDDFFTLGGHSLLATQVVARLRQTCGVELPLRAVFEAPTVAALARRVGAAMKEDQGLAAPPLEPVERDGDTLPLSFGQERLWLMHRLEPENPAYNLPSAVRLQGSPDVAALEDTLSELERRHEVLRSVFVERQGEPRVEVLPPRRRRLPVVDLSHLPAPLARRVGDRLAEAEARRPFDLARGPLVRARLLRRAADEHEVLFVTHHIVSDGWSSSVLAREMSVLSSAYSEGRPSPLAEPPIQYADFAHWQRRWIRGDVRRALVDYWRRRLAGAPELLLPTDRPDVPRQRATGSYVAFSVPEPTADGLRRLARRHGATLFMVLLAAFKALLHRTTGQEDLVVGTDVAGRDRAETAGLVGFFVNNIVLRNDLSGDPPFNRLLGRVRETTLEDFAHQDLPYDELVRALRPKRDPRRATPLFRLLFVLQNLPRARLDLSSAGVATWRGFDLGVSKFDLAVFLSEGGDGIAGNFNFSDELFDAVTLESLGESYRHLLDSVCRDPATRLSRLDLVGRDAKARRAPDGLDALRGRRSAVGDGGERDGDGEPAASASGISMRGEV